MDRTLTLKSLLSILILLNGQRERLAVNTTYSTYFNLEVENSVNEIS